MTLTIVGKSSTESLVATGPPVVYVSPSTTWSALANWNVSPDLEWESSTWAMAQHDLSRCTFKRRYGSVERPYQVGASQQGSTNIASRWVRVSVMTNRGQVDLFVGRLAGEAREAHAKSSAPSGIQTWEAYGPMWLLSKINVSQSWHKILSDDHETAVEYLLGWVPGMNMRDERGLLIGNRSDAVSEETGYTTYLYGRPESTDGVWTNLQYVKYLIERFVEQRDGAGDIVGPTWNIGGQTGLLNDMTGTIPWGTSQSVADMLTRLIPRRSGVDFTVIPDETGFEIRVSALSERARSYLGVTLPRNPNTVKFQPTTDRRQVRTRVIATHQQRYGKVRILGGRIVAAFTLEGAKVAAGQVAAAGQTNSGEETLQRKWMYEAQLKYMAGTGATEPTADGYDAARRQDRYRTIYRAFGAPRDWNHQNGAIAPVLNSDGSLPDASSGAWQNIARGTLPWLPMRDGYDYSTGEAVNAVNAPLHESEMMPPAAWLFDEDKNRYVLAEEVGIGVSVPGNDWGVFLGASPNHLLALNNWSGANSTDTEPVYDYGKAVATIAIRTDTRFMLEYEDEDAGPMDGVMELVDETAELHYLAPGTVYGMDAEGKLLRTPMGKNLVTRDDRLRLAFAMAGAISRYIDSRARGVVVMVGLVPHNDIIGHIATVLEAGYSAQQVSGPVTQVEYVNGDPPQTIIRVGYGQ